MTLPELAEELQTTDRTLRRALSQGLLRAERPSPRTVNVPIAERAYLRRSWHFLATLREALRTEPGIAFAILFGSRARGDARPDSDVDLVVGFRGTADRRGLESRLAKQVGASVQVVPFQDALKTPRLLAEVIREGRVLIDREAAWPRLLAKRHRIVHAAARENRLIDRQFERAFTSAA